MATDQNLSTRVIPLRTLGEEIANSVTHGLGLALSIAGGGVLLATVIARGDAWTAVGCALYSLSLIAVYGASTLSHALTRPELKQRFRSWDEGSIYLLIAGSYTPIAAVYLRDGWWWLLTAAIWTLALIGFWWKVSPQRAKRGFLTWSYLALGFLPMVALVPMLRVVPGSMMQWYAIGGFFYTVGTIFFVCDKKMCYLHAVWHLFVVAGSACHFVGVWQFVARA